MKLNYKRTLFVGFAFFLICAFWQAYDALVPKILTDKFGLSQTVSGIIMAMDNLFALFLLPWFGAISDKYSGKHGKRKPFVLIGTILACVAIIALSFADNAQLKNISDVSEDTRGSLETLYDAELNIKMPDASEQEPLRELVDRESFVNTFDLKETDSTAYERNYTDYVIPARQAYAERATSGNFMPLIAFCGVLAFLLIAMGTFRSPAVALMPDVTPSPLRSKANAVINLMGAVGGTLILVLGILFGTGKIENSLMSYGTFFTVLIGIMVIALALFMFLVKEKKWTDEANEINLKLDDDKDESGNRKLNKGEKLSLILILSSVVLWFMGYNAVTSKYSVYAGNVLGLDYNLTLIIAQGAAIVSYLPIGMIASKIGRKKSIVVGVAMLSAAFTTASFLRAGSSLWMMNAIFILAGIGWAAISVNSYPMVVELSKGSNIGKYTGYYYTASMAAQALTPYLSGIFLDIKLTTLFPYAAIFTLGSLVTMLFVKHGDNKPVSKASIEAFGAED